MTAAPPPGPLGSGLPVGAVEAQIRRAVNQRGTLVLVAEPGAGKSTVVPLWVADEVPGRVVLLQPRRLAARATAARLAERWGEPVGGTVGLTMRGEHRVSERTRIEVVTEAVLTRRVQDDPSLEGTSAVVFDEFHERSVAADLGLALSLQARQVLRPDLVLVVMSATLEAGPVARLLGQAPVISVPGRAHPVRTVHRPRPRPEDWAAEVAATTRVALADTDGDVLVFVPGRAEIDAVRRLLPGSDGVEVAALHSGTSPAEQRRLLAPVGTRTGRRVIVATAVAETSITLSGVTAVVDGGRLRQPRFDARSGIGRLETVGVTRFAADQRRGRAGRTGPGTCYRLWPRDEEHHLAPQSPPEVLTGDPLPLALELLRWGDPDGVALSWLDAPPPPRMAAARRALVAMGLATEAGALTAWGRRAARLPLHPRLAALVLTGSEAGLGPLAVRCAAFLDLDRPAATVELKRALDDAGRHPELERRAGDLARRAGTDGSGRSDVDSLGLLLAAAWPDRVARRRAGGEDRYLLAGGGEVRLGPAAEVGGAEFLVVADAGGLQAPPVVRLAVALTRDELVRAAGKQLRWDEVVVWDDQLGDVRAERRQQLAQLVLHREPLPDPDPEELAAALAHGVRRQGLDRLGWSERARQLQERVGFLRCHGHELGPLDDEALVDRLDEWLVPALGTRRSMAELSGLDPLPLLHGLLSWEERRQLDRLAPEEVSLPGGRSRPLRYDGGTARLAVKVQDLFGLDRHPSVLDGTVAVVVELLSPAGRPAQVTTDLPGFWRGSYAQVRAALRGRYPKHRWPEEPWQPPPAHDRPRSRP